MMFVSARTLLWAGLAAAMLSRVAESQETVTEPDAEIARLDGRIVQFFENVSQQREQTAFEDLLVGSPLATQEEKVGALVDATSELDEKYGAYRSFERIAAKRVSKDLVLLKYLYKCENFPVVWYFTYYVDFKRNDATSDTKNWILIAIRFDTELELLGF